jgi:hypothetical protein
MILAALQFLNNVMDHNLDTSSKGRRGYQDEVEVRVVLAGAAVAHTFGLNLEGRSEHALILQDPQIKKIR